MQDTVACACILVDSIFIKLSFFSFFLLFILQVIFIMIRWTVTITLFEGLELSFIKIFLSYNGC